jgi:hypothetical protein
VRHHRRRKGVRRLAQIQRAEHLRAAMFMRRTATSYTAQELTVRIRAGVDRRRIRRSRGGCGAAAERAWRTRRPSG